MSLVRLLTSGRSLIGLQDSTNRFRMRTKNLLPRFGSGRNPFTTAAPAPVPVPARAANQFARYQMTPAEMAAARLKETKRLPTVASVETKSAVGRPAAIRKFSLWATQWVQRLKPLVRWPRRRPGPRLAILGLDKPPVQGELSLENIKVVRNDLSDADVEIVPAKPAVKPKPEPSVPTARAAALIKT